MTSAFESYFKVIQIQQVDIDQFLCHFPLCDHRGSESLCTMYLAFQTASCKSTMFNLGNLVVFSVASFSGAFTPEISPELDVIILALFLSQGLQNLSQVYHCSPPHIN